MIEPVSDHPQIKRWLNHIYKLAVEIGPRGSTTDEERQAAEYAKEELKKMGLVPVWQDFKSGGRTMVPARFTRLMAESNHTAGGRSEKAPR